MEIMGLIGMLFSLALSLLFVFIIIKVIKKALGGSNFANAAKIIKNTNFAEIAKLSQDEKVGFQNMMMTPNDETVSAYIAVLKRLADYSAQTAASQNMTTGMQMKYVNAYNVIKKTDTVSDEKKNELGRMFLVMGAAVSLD